MRIDPYLFFDGDAEEAFRFYEEILDGDLQAMQRYKDIPDGGDDLTPAQQEFVLHASLEFTEEYSIMGSDVIEGMGDGHIEGTNVAISVYLPTTEEADRVFHELAEEGTISMPLEEQFWGDYYGSLTDRFGINWMVSASLEDPQG